MRAVLLRSLLVIGVGGLALAGLLYVASTVDARPPAVLGIAITQPVGGDPNLALITTSIEITFSEPVEADAAAEAIHFEPAVEGAASWSGSTLIFTPADALELSTAYEVTVATGVRDLAGNAMTEAPPPFVFETAGRPRIVGTDPVDGAVDVPVEQPIGITFSSLMDTAVVESALRVWPVIRYEVRWSGERVEIRPTEPLRPDTTYEVSLSSDATDAAGVAIGQPFSIAFTTVEPGLRADRLVPADGVGGIAPTTVIAVIFDRPVDPGSVDGAALRITPDVAGTLDVATLPGEEPGEEPGEGGAGRVLRFTASGPLPANTTFEVEIAAEIVAAEDGGGLAQPLSWSFTTGAPAATLSNQITFLSDRSGVANVWAMNADGTGQHQVSAELAPVLDYAVAPDGSSLVVADGRRLVFLRADGADRRVITGDEFWEFDPTYAPSGRVLAFGRADAASGEGLGLWQWEVGGGDPQPIELPASVGPGPPPSASDDDATGRTLRAPRYSPDGLALAFVDASGAVGVLELPAQRLTLVPFAAAAPPAWLPDSSAVLLGGTPLDAPGDAEPLLPPVERLVPGAADAVHRLARSGVATRETSLGAGWRVLAVALEGTIAYATEQGRLGTTPDEDELDGPLRIGDARVIAAAFAPGEDAMVIVVAAEDAAAGRIERLDLAGDVRTVLSEEGWLPRWLP